MFIGQQNQLSDQLIYELGYTPGQTAQDLRAKLAKNGKEYSIRAVFKVLNQLQEEGIVLKVEGSYRLRLTWALQLVNFAEDVLERYEELPLLEGIISSEETKFTWDFRDLRRVDDFWIQIATLLFQHTEERSMYYWIRNAWFYLAHPEKDKQFQKVCKRNDNRIYMIVGDPGPIDEMVVKTAEEGVYHTSFASSPFDKEKKASLAVIGDYIITVQIAKKLREDLQELYKSIYAAGSFDLDAIRSLFAQRGKCSLHLEKNRRKAKRLLGQFRRHFGPES